MTVTGRDITTRRQALAYFVQRASVRTMVALLVVTVVGRVWWGGWSGWELAGPALVIVVQPFTEWVVHIRILHRLPGPILGRTVDLPAARAHRNHHRHPHDPRTSFVPLPDLLSLLLVAAAVGAVVARSVGGTLTTLAGALVMFLIYEWVHFLIHTAVRPRSTYYRHLVTSHRLHHFRNEHYWLGITTTLGDRVLRTAPDRSEVPLSPTARTLGVTDAA